VLGLQALGVTILEMASGSPVPAEGDAYHGLREGRVQIPAHLSPDFEELIKILLHVDPAWRPGAREIVRHPMLCGLMRDESIACLRTQPRTQHDQQRTSASLMESDIEPELMLSVQSRALKAEKEVVRLRAKLLTAQHEATMWRDRVQIYEQTAPCCASAATPHSYPCSTPAHSSKGHSAMTPAGSGSRLPRTAPSAPS